VLPAMRLHVIGGAYFVITGNHRLGVARCCQGGESGKERQCC